MRILFFGIIMMLLLLSGCLEYHHDVATSIDEHSVVTAEPTIKYSSMVSMPCNECGGNKTTLVRYLCNCTFNEEKVKQHFVAYLNSEMTGIWVAPSYSESLSELAMAHARNGTNSFRIAGDTPEEAIKVFDLFESQHYQYWESTHWLSSNQNDHPGVSYGIAVYKTGNQYNVSVVYNTPQPVTTVYLNGVHRVYQPPDVISYLWNDGAYQP